MKVKGVGSRGVFVEHLTNDNYAVCWAHLGLPVGFFGSHRKETIMPFRVAFLRPYCCENTSIYIFTAVKYMHYT